MQKLAAGVMLGMFGWMGAGGSAMRHSDFYFGLAIWILGLATGSCSFWLYAHLREAIRVLGYSQFPNQKS